LRPEQVFPSSIHLLAHELQLSVSSIRNQIYDGLKATGEVTPTFACFPFGAQLGSAARYRPWPKMGDFRDSLVRGLLSSPPADEHQCAAIKKALLADLEKRRCSFSARSREVKGDELVIVNRIVAGLAVELAHLSESDLTHLDMREFACLEIRGRIRQMVDGDIASGTLLVGVDGADKDIGVDALVAWAAPKRIQVEQESLPGCLSYVHESYRRLHQQSAGESVEAGKARDTANREISASMPVPGATHQAPVAETVIVHRLESRAQPMSAEIATAIKQAVNPDDAASVWDALTKLAKEKFGCMVGNSAEGIKYRGKNFERTGDWDFLTYQNLCHRLGRRKRRLRNARA
jgi:hypothetical protein